MSERDDLMVNTRGFPLTPAEKQTDQDATVVQVTAGQTVTADNSHDEIFVIHAQRADVAGFVLEGQDLVVEFADGSKLTIRDFFGGSASDQLVFIDGDQPYWVDFTQALDGVGDGIADDLVEWFVPVEQSDSTMLLVLGVLGALAIAGVAAGGGGDDDSSGLSRPTIALLNDTGVDSTDKTTSNGELALKGIKDGARVEYSTDGGENWTSDFKPVDGENTVQVRQIDVDGNISEASAALTFTLDQKLQELIGTAGDDVITVDSAGFERVDGGGGFDVLKVTDSGLSFDLGNVKGIESVDLSVGASNANTLNVTLQGVLSDAPDATPRTLKVSGDAEDTVNLKEGDGFAHAAGNTEVIDGVTFDVYQAGTGGDLVTLLLQQDMQVHQVP